MSTGPTPPPPPTVTPPPPAPLKGGARGAAILNAAKASAAAVALKKVQKATRVRTNAIPRHSKKCTICTNTNAGSILQDKLAGMSHADLAAKYFPGRVEKTICNSLSTHWKKHVNVNASVALLPTVLPAAQGSTSLAVSTQRIFNQEARKRVNAQADIEALIGLLKERVNLLEDEFLASHMLEKCDECGRADSPFNDMNTKKFCALVKSFNDLVDRWLKIKNPKAVIKYFFDSTFLKFVEHMMGYYVTNLQEKGRLIRQAFNEYNDEKISFQLLMRRVTEVEDVGAQAMAERGIMELRSIQDYIEKEFSKQGWGD